ncbi:Transport inhibitor response 1-like [Datura stramonium]|uniref:Transport inhibitor response 1-like n=1 Tax=Datura stramonium TaxID=4076 RepID=A0ABS8SDN0_DATST|nr:Transport inhibitor response 1-like [Datura stramonium]
MVRVYSLPIWEQAHLAPRCSLMNQNLIMLQHLLPVKSVVCLSVSGKYPEYLPAIYPVCCNSDSLNFSYAANINTEQFKSVISRCHKLQVLWVLTLCVMKDLRQLLQHGEIANHRSRLVVEVFSGDDEEGNETSEYVNTLYMYRSLDGPRADVPSFVQIL